MTMEGLVSSFLKKWHLPYLILLLIAMITCGFISLYHGKDIGTDLANYHFFIPYEFLYHRHDWDYWPASYPHVFFSPSADFLCYGLIKYFSAKNAVFISGAIHGINLWLLVLIAKEFIPQTKPWIAFAILTACLGMYGPFGWTAIGDFSADHLTSIFILSFVYWQLKALRCFTENTFNLKIFVAGLLLGMAIGLKLTAVLFVVGAYLSIISLTTFSYLLRFKTILVLSLGILSGDLVTSGYWIKFLWLNYHNPVYPFFQNVFNHLASDVRLHESYAALQPAGFIKKLFYPFYFSVSGNNERSFRDFRFVIVYVLLVLTMLKQLSNRLIPKVVGSYQWSLSEVWLLWFFIFSYIVGQSYFGSLRYVLALEMMAPLVIFIFIKALFPTRKTQAILSLVIFYSLALNMYPTYFPLRVADYNQSYLEVELPDFVKNRPQAMVLLAYPSYGLEQKVRPFVYLIPFFPQKWQFIGLGYLNGQFIADTTMKKQIYTKIANYSHPIFLLTTRTVMPKLINTARQFSLALVEDSCMPIHSARERFTGDAILCAVKR